MATETRDLHQVSLSSLTFEARELLSCLLNTPKLLLSDGPDKLPRDWRGLASLVNISAEIAHSYESGDKTAKVIQYWLTKSESTATIGMLLKYVRRIDRYDIFDDFMDLDDMGKLYVTQRPPISHYNNQIANRADMQLAIPEDDPYEELITFDDKIHGSPQFYNAYVLFAQEDREFVDEMLMRMREKGHKMCIEDDLLPDHSTPYAPVSRLISSERCHRIVLVYSPDFLTSPANTFYMDYAQAVGIEMKKPKIIPCMYRVCQLPRQVSFYHKLYFSPPGVVKTSYDFWERLSCSLDVLPPRLNGYSSPSCSSVNIQEMDSTMTINGQLNQFLALPSPHRSKSMNGIDHLRQQDSLSSLSSGSQSETKTKSSILKNMMNTLKLKKKKSKKSKKDN